MGDLPNIPERIWVDCMIIWTYIVENDSIPANNFSITFCGLFLFLPIFY